MRLFAWADLYSCVGMLELFNVPKESWEPVLSFAIMVIHPRHSLKHQVVLCRKGSHIANSTKCGMAVTISKFSSQGEGPYCTVRRYLQS